MTVQLNFPQCGLAATPLLLQVSVPTGIAPTGSVAANGALTLGTALQQTYGPTGVSPGIWLFLPAGAAFATSPAALYWCVMTSTTLGTIFNTTYTNLGANLTPLWIAPLNPTPIVAGGPGAYTGVTSTQTMGIAVVPANTMGANGSVRMSCQFSMPNTAGTKTIQFVFGASGIVVFPTFANILAASVSGIFSNRGATNQQIGIVSATAGLGTSTTATSNLAVDTTAARGISLQGTLATATDYVILEQTLIEILFAP